MSKDLQINYILKVTDLTGKDIDTAIANMERFYKAKDNLERDSIIKRQKVRDDLANKKALEKQKLNDKLFAKKALESQKLNDKKANDAYLKRYKQLLSRRSEMDKASQLKTLKGNEQALRNYIKNSEKKLSGIRSKVFSDDDHRRRYDNTLKELSLMNMKNRAEIMLGQAINSNNRKRERTLKLQRELAERQRNMNIAVGAASATGLYAGGRASIYSFGQAMTLEQLGISMRAQYGVKEGNLALEEMKKYARDTAFTLKESTQLLLGVKIGAGNIGIKTTEQQIRFTKDIGKAILAYGGNIEDRYEIGHQLSQIFMAGKANERQDLRVMQRRGLPIYTALQAMTGMNFEQLKNKYGAELPADLIAKAMIFMVKSPEVMRAWSEREASFVQSWESTTEQFGYTAGALGIRIANLLGLPKMLRSVTKGLSSAEDLISGKNDKQNKTDWVAYTSSMTFMTLAALSLKGAITLLVKGFQYFAGTTLAASLGMNGMALAAKTLGKSFTVAYGIASGFYLIMTDWGSMIENINKDGFSGLLKDLDKAVAILGVLGGGYAIGGFAGMAVAAIGLSAVGAYKLTIGQMKKHDEMKWQNLRKEFNTPLLQTSRIPLSDPISSIVRDRKLERDQSFKPSLGVMKAEVKVNNYFDSENREVKTETSVKNPFAAPIIYEHWDKQKYNFGY